VRVEGRRGAVLVGVFSLLLGVAGCGADDFENDPRPPAPVELTAKVDDESVLMSPAKVGAGLAVITVSNQSRDPINLTLVGPAPNDNSESGEIAPGGVGNLKAELVEGEYEVNAGETSAVKAAQLEVGPERESSQNDLLLP
jgi:hypothetical protein